MIKTSILILAAASLTGATTLPAADLSPKSVDITAGTVSVIKTTEGTKLSVAAKPDYALRVTTKKNHKITIRF